MSEERVPVTPVMIVMRCDRCGRGLMESTGASFSTSFETTFPHRCTECGREDAFTDVKYPNIVYDTDPIEPFTSTDCTCKYDESEEATNHARTCPVSF